MSSNSFYAHLIKYVIVPAIHEPIFGMYPVIVNPNKNHASLLVKCQNDMSFTRAFKGVNFRPNFNKRSGVIMPGSRKFSKAGAGGSTSRPG